MPATSEVTEFDELYTFAGSENRYFLITQGLSTLQLLVLVEV